MYYTSLTKANYYDCDCLNALKISSALKYMQQASSEQMEHNGFPVEKLVSENNMVFLLSKMCVKVHRMPICNEALIVGTAPLEPKGVRFYREFVIESSVGERLISAFSVWILVEPATRKVLRPASFPYEFRFEAPLLTQVIGDVALPKGLELTRPCLEQAVRYSHIDVNNHLTNTSYADFICDALPYPEFVQKGLDTLVISFQNEAKWGDILRVHVNGMQDGSYYVAGKNGQKDCFEALAKLKSN